MEEPCPAGLVCDSVAARRLVTSAGYSGTPLAQKLGIKEGSLVLLIDPPSAFVLETPAGAKVLRRAKPGIDVALLFTTARRGLVDRFLEVAGTAKENAGIWVAWPKKTSKVETDVTEDVLREELLPTGFVDNKVCAIDADWSAIRFTRRK